MALQNAKPTQRGLERAAGARATPDAPAPSRSESSLMRNRRTGERRESRPVRRAPHAPGSAPQPTVTRVVRGGRKEEDNVLAKRRGSRRARGTGLRSQRAHAVHASLGTAARTGGALRGGVRAARTACGKRGAWSSVTSLPTSRWVKRWRTTRRTPPDRRPPSMTDSKCCRSSSRSTWPCAHQTCGSHRRPAAPQPPPTAPASSSGRSVSLS